VDVPLSAVEEEYVEVVVRAASRDASIARVLREICDLDTSARRTALLLVGAHLRAAGTASDVLDCIAALQRDVIARRLGQRLGAAG
jgi:hypothetical protein